MDTVLYLKLSLLFFFQFAIWGAWAPVLAARLLGPLKMTGKQTGWIYATLPLASMVSPLVAGQIADQWLDMGLMMGVSHAVCAILLFVAAKQQKFAPLFIVMLLYSLFFGATLALANAMVFRHIGTTNGPKVFIWAPIAWAAIGYALTGWRSTRKTEGDGSDCLVLAAVLSVVMAVVCFIQPATPPQPTEGAPVVKALSLLQDPLFVVFLLVQLIGAGVMQCYFLGTAQFLQDSGVKSKLVPGSMAVAQVAQAVATYFLLSYLYTETIGPRWTITAGASCWLLLFLVYVTTRARGLLVAAQALHGLAYVLFIQAGWMYIGDISDKNIAASAQALIVLVQNGIGMFLGTQLAGAVMDKYSVEGKFQWRKIFTVPLMCILVGVVALVIGTKDPKPNIDEKGKPAIEKTQVGGTSVDEIKVLDVSPGKAETENAK